MWTLRDKDIQVGEVARTGTQTYTCGVVESQRKRPMSASVNGSDETKKARLGTDFFFGGPLG
jgi:hypothetical protein